MLGHDCKAKDESSLITCCWCFEDKPRKEFIIIDSATEGDVCKECHNAIG